jgi:DNA repair exonuclease SbcCD ATPase subunit
VSEDQEVQATAPLAGVVSPPEVPPEKGGGTPTKPRSGFARMKMKVEALKRRLQELEDSHETLQDDYEAVSIEHDRLLADFAKLESAFAEVTDLNAALANELQQLKQRPSGPVRYGASNLMGV